MESRRPASSSTVTRSLSRPSTLLATRCAMPCDHVGRRRLAVAQSQHHGSLRRLLGGAAEALRLVKREVHLGRLHAAHLADRALQLTLQRAAVVHALREVRHPPRRLVEQLQAGTSLGRHSLAREQHARLREVGGRHHDLRAALIEAVLDAGALQLVRHRAHLLEREPGERGHPRRGGRPAREHEDECDRGEPDEHEGDAARSAGALDVGLEKRRHLRQLCMLMMVL